MLITPSLPLRPWLPPVSGLMLAASGAVLLAASWSVILARPSALPAAWPAPDGEAALEDGGDGTLPAAAIWTVPPGPEVAKRLTIGPTIPRSTPSSPPRPIGAWIGHGRNPTTGTAGDDLRAALAEMAADTRGPYAREMSCQVLPSGCGSK